MSDPKPANPPADEPKDADSDLRDAEQDAFSSGDSRAVADDLSSGDSR